jgi:hypothetical protein
LRVENEPPPPSGTPPMNRGRVDWEWGMRNEELGIRNEPHLPSGLPSATSFLQGIACEHPLLLLRSSVPPMNRGRVDWK